MLNRKVNAFKSATANTLKTLIGGLILVFYSIIPTLQPFPNFGRIYATYGGVFIVMSLLWSYKIDNYMPDKYDIIGAMVALLGVAIIYYAPRQ